MLASQRRYAEVARSRVPITNPPSMVHSAAKATTATAAGPAWPASSPSSLVSPPSACCAERAGERSVVDSGRGRSVHGQHGPLRPGTLSAWSTWATPVGGRGRSEHGQRGPFRSVAGALDWLTRTTATRPGRSSGQHVPLRRRPGRSVVNARSGISN